MFPGSSGYGRRLEASVEYLESSEYVVLKVKPLETREKQSV